jgi:hypothetical protein
MSFSGKAKVQNDRDFVLLSKGLYYTVPTYLSLFLKVFSNYLQPILLEFSFLRKPKVRSSKIRMTIKNTYTNNTQDVRHTSKQQDAKLLPYILSCKKCETLHIKSLKHLPCKLPDFL